MRWSYIGHIYLRLISQHFKAIVEYQLNFVIMLLAGVFTHVPGLIFLWLIYARIPTIQGWSFGEVLFIYGMTFFTEGITSLIVEGFWMLGRMVHRGELDRYLVRPVPLPVQILGSAVGLHGIGPTVIGAALIGQALAHAPVLWTPARVAAALVLLISAIVIRCAIVIVPNAIVFWAPGVNSRVAVSVAEFGDFAKYPISIYGLGLQALVTLVVPFAFISFFPATYLFDKPDGARWGLLVPVVAVYSLIVTLAVWRRGLRRYESTGH
jgi:ABC-2 type transport system permease protein